MEEETDPKRFSVHRLAHYCLDIAELIKTDRVVPVVIFLHPGNYPLGLQLGGDRNIYLNFRFIACDLGRMPVDQYLHSTNIVARLNLPNMAYSPERRIEVYASAQEGLAELEPSTERQLKYVDYIDQYARHPKHRNAASLISKRLRIRISADGLETNQGWHDQVSGAQSDGAPLPSTTTGRKVAKGNQERQQW